MLAHLSRDEYEIVPRGTQLLGLAPAVLSWNVRLYRLLQAVLDGLILADALSLSVSAAASSQMPKYMASALSVSGNYAEMYARHLEGFLTRRASPCALWTSGGLLHPFR